MNFYRVLLPVIVIVFFSLISPGNCKRNSRRNRPKEGGSDASSNSSTPVPLEDVSESSRSNRSHSRVYSVWSPWTRCSRRCRQTRTRHCTVPSQCGTNLLREERACFTDRCKDKKVTEDSKLLDEILDDQDRSEFRILYHLKPSLYSEWTSWSPCSRSCLTSRTRSCQMPQICGDKVFQENALCYVDGSICERLYTKKKRRRKSSNEIDGTKTHPLSGLKCGIAPKVSGLRSLLRIIGGREADRGGWPWQVTILNKFREPFCGGTLLSQGWVLTAAHCIRRKLIVRAGEHDLMSNEGTEQESRVVDYFVHPDYDADTVNNDIALLLMKQPFTFDQNVQPVCLPNPGDELAIGALATILGWGKRKNTAIFGTDLLHQAEVPVVNIKACRENYEHYHITNNMMCAGYKKGRVDSCAGDSGGPLLFQQNDKWTVYGITSFGEGCGQKGKYGIYAKVSKFVKWIKKTTAKYS